MSLFACSSAFQPGILVKLHDYENTCISCSRSIFFFFFFWKHHPYFTGWNYLWVQCVCVHSVVPDFVTPWTVARQASLSMEFPRQKYWNGLPFPPPGDLPDRGMESVSCISFMDRRILYQLHYLGSGCRLGLSQVLPCSNQEVGPCPS